MSASPVRSTRPVRSALVVTHAAGEHTCAIEVVAGGGVARLSLDEARALARTFPGELACLLRIADQAIAADPGVPR